MAIAAQVQWYRRMELRHLRYFQAVAEELSFSKAARRLRIAQPALSRAVQELEHALEVELFIRSRRGVTLTDAGAVMLAETALLLQRVEDAVRRVRRTAAGEEGELRVGYIGPPTQAFLGRLLAEFRRRHPRVSVILEERTPERVWEMVAKGRLEIGLTRPVLGRHLAELQTILLRREPLCAALPGAHRLARHAAIPWRELAGEPLVMLARREGVGLHDAVLAACRRARFTPRIAHTPSVVGTVLSYAEAGEGIGIVTDSVAATAPARGLKFPALTPAQTVDLVAVSAREVSSPPLREFLALIEDWMNRGLLWPHGGSRNA